jgi:transposase-like protein
VAETAEKELHHRETEEEKQRNRDEQRMATNPMGGDKPPDTTNQRNGTSGKTVLTDDGPLTLDIPRDHDGTFEPRGPGLCGRDVCRRRLAGLSSVLSPMPSTPR